MCIKLQNYGALGRGGAAAPANPIPSPSPDTLRALSGKQGIQLHPLISSHNYYGIQDNASISTESVIRFNDSPNEKQSFQPDPNNLTVTSNITNQYYNFISNFHHSWVGV